MAKQALFLFYKEFFKMMKSKIATTFLICIVCSLMPLLSHAQLDPGCNPDLPCPIDGGLSLLIAAGIGIGAKKAYAARKGSAKV
jgi:hypothetical protein